MIKRCLFEFARKHSARLSLLFEVLLWAFTFVFLVASWNPERRKRVRRRGSWGIWFYGLRTRFVSSSVERLMSRMSRIREGAANQRWKQRLTNGLYLAGSHFMMAGNLALAAKCFEASLELTPLASKRAVHNYRTLGATYFMLGDLESAHRAFEHAGRGRKLILDAGAASSRVRHLGLGWFVAIGHVAMLDFYFKRRLLGWGETDTDVLLTNHPKSIPGGALVLEYCKYGLKIVHHLGIHKAYDRFKDRDELGWGYLSDDERFATMDDFWEYEFPDGEILTYTHAAARIQRQWEKEGRAALLALDDEQKDVLRRVLREMGVPATGWYVCLHVREPGFHAAWNAKYPTLRDADIEDYIVAMKTITGRGGHVIRVGDPTMKRLPRMDGVFDYAHSNLKSKPLDILLPAACRFFVGTNSGYATIPGIYGVPNVLTNWVPIALPLWFGRDLMIPKLFYDQSEGRVVDFKTMFSTRLGAIQNLHDLPEPIEIRSNTPEDINEVVIEMLNRVENRAFYTPEDNTLQERYHGLAEQHGSFRGSRLGRDFLRKYADLVWAGEPATVSTAAETMHETQADRRAAVPVAR